MIHAYGADCVQFASNAIFSTISAGCMGLVMQREIMEDMREEPFVINKDESFFWEVIFTSESLDLDSVQYTNETPIDFYDTISKMSITFRAEFPILHFLT